jgi:adenine-specific DNA-methyltransferase
VFPAIDADGESIAPETADDKVWRWAKSSYFANKARIVVKRVRSSNLVGKDGAEVKWNVFTKTYLNDVIKDATAKPNSLIEDHINQNSSHELNELGVPFSFANPSSLIGYLCELSRTKDDDLVMDFFAGSGTTGHAIFSANRSGTTRLRFLLVQLPEPLDPEDKDQKECAQFCDKLKKPRTIAELTKERLRRAGKKIQEENPMFAGDLGFRVFKLASSNIQAWEPDRDRIAETLEASIEHLKTERTEQDILFELLLKLGLDLCVPIQTRKVEGAKKQTHEIHSIGGGSLLVCLTTSILQADVEPLALALVAWHKELKPAGESTVVFRDSAFADDVAKTNLTAILQQHDLETVRSL